MFKNWFKSANEKRMEEQIVKLREDIVVLQSKITLLEKQLEVKITVEDVVVKPTVEELSNVLEPREELSNVLEFEQIVVVDVVKPAVVKEEEPVVAKEEEPVVAVKEEEPIVDVVKPAIVKEEEPVVAVKVEEPIVVTVEKETNTVPPKKRRQSKKAHQLEEALPK